MTKEKREELTLGELLILLMEECAEVSQAASKCLRFGYDTKGPHGYGINRKVLASEIGDLLGVVDSLPDIEQYLVITARNAKMRRAEEAKAKYGMLRYTPTPRSMKSKRVPTCKEALRLRRPIFSSSKEDGGAPRR